MLLSPYPEVNFDMRRTSGQAAERIAEVEELIEPLPGRSLRDTARERLFRELSRDAAQDPKEYVTSWEVRGGGE